MRIVVDLNRCLGYAQCAFLPQMLSNAAGSRRRWRLVQVAC
jgi:hypothetical protein